jgi:hypothetical protein
MEILDQPRVGPNLLLRAKRMAVLNVEFPAVQRVKVA